MNLYLGKTLSLETWNKLDIRTPLLLKSKNNLIWVAGLQHCLNQHIMRFNDNSDIARTGWILCFLRSYQLYVSLHLSLVRISLFNKCLLSSSLAFVLISYVSFVRVRFRMCLTSLYFTGFIQLVLKSLTSTRW